MQKIILYLIDSFGILLGFNGNWTFDNKPPIYQKNSSGFNELLSYKPNNKVGILSQSIINWKCHVYDEDLGIPEC